MTESNGFKIGQAHLNDSPLPLPSKKIKAHNTKHFTTAKVCNNRIIKTLCFHLFTKDFENSSSNINLFHPHNIAHLRLYSLFLYLSLFGPFWYPLYSYPVLSHTSYVTRNKYKKFNIMMEISTIKLWKILREIVQQQMARGR